MAENEPRSVDPLAVDPEPPGNFSFAQMIPTLVVDVAMPIIAFNLLTHYGVSTLWALAAGGLFPASNNIRVWIKSRKLEPLGIIVMSFLVVGTAASLISGSVFFALIKESFLTAAFGFICLGSLMAERPLMFYINRQFVAGDDPGGWHGGTACGRNFRTLRAAQICFRDRGVGNRLHRRSAGQSWLCAGHVAGAGGGDLARDGIRRDDRADRVDAAIHARDA